MSPRLALTPLLLLAAACGAGTWTPAPAATIPIAPLPAPKPAPVAAPKGPSAIDAALPPAGELPTLAHTVACNAKTCRLAELLPDGARPSAGDKSPIWSWEATIAKGSTLAFPRDAEVDVLGVVLKGRLELRADEQKTAEAEPFGGWHAFQAPGAGVALRAIEGEARVVLVVASSGKPLAELVAARAAKKGPAAWKKREAPVSRVDLGSVAPTSWGNGAYHVRYAFEGERARRASLDVLLASKDAPVAEHAHDKEWELLDMLDGAGALAMPQAEGDAKTAPMNDGAIARVPAGQRHAWKPAGTAPLLAIQAYAPPGPEQRFKKLAGH